MPTERLKNAVESFEKRIKICVGKEGYHLTLFSKPNLICKFENGMQFSFNNTSTFLS